MHSAFGVDHGEVSKAFGVGGGLRSMASGLTRRMGGGAKKAGMGAAGPKMPAAPSFMKKPQAAQRPASIANPMSRQQAGSPSPSGNIGGSANRQGSFTNRNQGTTNSVFGNGPSSYRQGIRPGGRQQHRMYGG